MTATTLEDSKEKNRIIAIIFEDKVFICLQEGKDITTVTVIEFDEDNKDKKNWFYQDHLFIKEKSYD